jgi:hypothetical protein
VAAALRELQEGSSRCNEGRIFVTVEYWSFKIPGARKLSVVNIMDAIQLPFYGHHVSLIECNDLTTPPRGPGCYSNEVCLRSHK